MEYIKLGVGFLVIIVFGLYLLRIHQRSKTLIALTVVDTVLGVLAGFYLVGSSLHTMLF